MYRNLLSLIKLFSPIILVVTSCVIDVEEPFEESLFIEQFEVNYNQIDGQLYLQVGIEPGNKIIDEVFVIISANNFNSTIYLNDDGIEGDLVAQNNRFSAIAEINLPFQDYQIKAVVQTSSSQEFIQKKNITIEEQFAPEFVDVIFIKSYENNKYEFSNNSSPYYIDENEISHLNFEIKIKDLNGINNIKSVKYNTVTHWNIAEGNCGCNQGEDCPNSSPTFYLNNINSTLSDSIFTYVAINDYIKEPGFPINSSSICNRSGVITFSFVVFDLYFGPQTFVEELLFLPCSELNCEDDCENCPFGCGECGE